MKKIINNNKDNNLKKDTNKTNLKLIIVIFLLSRLPLLIYMIIKKDISIITSFDGNSYISIAKNGYITEKLCAFFPLYPLLIRLLNTIIHSYEISGFIISNICSFMSLIIINKIIEKDNLHNNMIFIFSPILIYSMIVYTESIFMFLTLLGYYLYKKEKYILSGIVIGLAILTRNSGIILWGAIGIDMLYRLFKKKDIKLKNIFIFGFISLLIGILYPLYLYITKNDFLYFIHIQEIYWMRLKGNIINMIINDIIIIKKYHRISDVIIFIENWFFFITTLILGIKIIKKDITSSTYIIISLLAFTATYRNINYWSTLASISLFRYVLNLFPIYLYIFDNKNNKYKTIITIFIIFISIYNMVSFYLNAFIA